MKVTVLGKEHRSGTSKKTGNDYSLNFVHVKYRQNGVAGEAVDTITLDAVTYPIQDINVGKIYDLDRDSRGFVIGFDELK